MKLLSSELNSPESRLKKAGSLIKRFTAGVAVGLTIAAIYFGYAQEWHPQPVVRSIMVSLTLASIVGGLTLKWGYSILQMLWESMNLP
ncbi:hypothetical protein [Chroococcidiopsis sp. CCMEE 29]|uniref:hypothetical protein n=1 Tax=Chroococcidiopsis sp. CCMEE 29 TaxID=155894 RepID=UPI002020B23F|nr:hypothetical protein [Chroococcidiopsis sp. CCMEE 29]